MRLMDFDGKVLLEDKLAVNVAPLASKVYLDWPLKKISAADGGDPTRVFISAELGGTDATISHNLIYLAPVKEVHLKPAALKVELASIQPLQRAGAASTQAASGANNEYEIKVTSPVLARGVYLSFGNLDVKLSDNYFDVLPGETAEVTITSAASLEDLKAQMKVISLTDAFASEKEPGASN